MLDDIWRKKFFWSSHSVHIQRTFASEGTMCILYKTSYIIFHRKCTKQNLEQWMNFSDVLWSCKIFSCSFDFSLNRFSRKLLENVFIPRIIFCSQNACSHFEKRALLDSSWCLALWSSLTKFFKASKFIHGQSNM